MNELAAKVERIVREVLAELSAARTPMPQPTVAPPPATPAAPPTPQSPAPVAVPVERKASADALIVGAHVVTLKELPDRLNAVRRVVVSRGAIVTPAVRDELLRRHIALEFAESASEERSAKKAVRLALIQMGANFDPTPLIASLNRDGFHVEHTALQCVIASTNQLATEVAKPDTLGLLLTRYTAAGLCLANRHRGVRAVTASDTPMMAALVRSVGANLLIADPKAGTFFQLKQMVTEFCKGGVRECPEVFRERLG
jgi:hypothetical protein